MPQHPTSIVDYHNHYYVPLQILHRHTACLGACKLVRMWGFVPSDILA